MLTETEPRPDALTAFGMARRAFMSGRRIEMQEIATDLGVSRATLFRWVGGRDQLVCEITWSLALPTFQRAIDSAHAERGGQRIAAVMGGFAAAVIGSEPFMSFVQREPERALRLLTTRASDFHRRLLELVERLLREEIEAGRVDPPLALPDLAYLILRITETFVYADVIAGQAPDPANVEEAIRALLRD
jgi:AcrR family transcriptional regulator